MPPTLPTQCAAATPIAAQTTPLLPTQTLAWLAERPSALTVVESVWNTLTELEAAGQHPRLLAAVRFVLIHHEPTRAGRCRACRRESWRGLWRRRRFPCVVWRQIRGELLGSLAFGSMHRLGATNGRSLRVMRLTGLERNGAPSLERRAATVAVRSVLHEVVALAEEAPIAGAFRG